MLALAALIGADARVPSMVLQRAPLGQRGSYIATVLNVAQCLGWAIFELIVIATAAGLLCDQLFGFEATWAWKLVFGGARRRARADGADRVRPPLRPQVRDLGGRRVGRLPRLVDPRRRRPRRALVGQPGEHHGSFWLAVDTVIAVTVSWAPLVADYTRFSRDRRSAFFGVGPRLPAPDAVPVRLRLDPRALARRRPEPPGADPDRDRGRRRRRLPSPCSR